ncbi:hypothetical protein [Bradyrhizobium sp. USDA 3315]
MTTGDSRLFFGFTGTTGLNGTQTITVIDGTHLDVTAVSFVATGAGSINGFWDTTNANNWVSSSGGTDYGQTVPSSADNATFDANSGGGTVTVNFGGTISLVGLTMGAFTGTFDNSVNNNNITCSGATNPFNLSGTGTRTIKLGTATYAITHGGGSWQMGTTTNLTFQGSSAAIVFTGGAGGKTFNGGSQTYGALTLGSTPGTGILFINGSNTFGTFAVTAPCFVQLQSASTTTLTGAVTIVGSSSSQIGISAEDNNTTATLALAGGSTFQWCGFRGVIFTGSPTITSSFDLGNNSGATISGPSSGGGSAGVIG